MLTTLPTILLVEDNPKDAELLCLRFEEARLQNPVQVVPDGVEAAKYLAGEGEYQDRKKYPLPGIIILDLHLPKMDGFEVLAWIRSRRQFDGLPVIILTSDDSDPTIEKSRAYGADGYLTKDSNLEGLVALLKNAFLGWALVPIADRGQPTVYRPVNPLC